MSSEQFIRLSDIIVEFEADLNDDQYPVTSIHALEVHREELKSDWIRFKQIYENLLIEKESSDSKKKGSSDIESYKNKYKHTYRTYCNCLSKLSEIGNLFVKSSTSHPVQNQVNSSISDARNLHLPPIDIEPFNGDYASWPTFRDVFTAVVNNSKASNVEKLFYLTQKTRGEAKEIVKKSPLTNQGFDLAWTELCSRFENRRVLVNGQLKTLFSLPTIPCETGKSLKQLQGNISSCISTLKLYDINVDSWDPILVFICTNHLPDITLTLWEQELKDKTAIPQWSDLDNFLTNRYRTLESVSEIRNSSNSKETHPKAKNNFQTSKKLNNFQVNVSSPECQLCPKAIHAVRKCPKFLNMDYNQRMKEIKKEGLCLNCFSKTHNVKNCSSKHNCFKCSKRHHTLLHKETTHMNDNSTRVPSTRKGNTLNPNSTPFTRSNTNTLQSTNASNTDTVQSCFATNSKDVLLGTAVVNIINKGVSYKVRALIDSGSEGTFISERLFNLLKLPYQKINAEISGLNNSVSAKVQRQCSLVLGTELNQNVTISATALVVPHLSKNLPSHTISSSSFDNLPDIRLADPNFRQSSKIDMLIGGDIFPSIISSGVRQKVCNSLIAQETIFGWILTGPIPRESAPLTTINSLFCEISLDKEISRFWEVENLPKKNFMSSSDQACEDLYVRNTKRNPDGRYIVSLPFKNDFPDAMSIGNSRSSAMAQFFRSEARLLRNPDFKLEYDRVVQEYEELGHMVRVEAPSQSENSEVYYLPHHAVIKPDSVTTKVRVVFNASSPSANGLSLNSLLHIGPILQNDLVLLIIKWRFFRFVFNADIQKMYRQILVDPSHTRYQRILFRDNPNSPLKDYELKTVTFGVNCAPYLAIRTLLQLADDTQSIYPVASSIIRNNMYMDDVLAGAYTKSDCNKAKSELIHALQSAGFTLRKWTSNSKDILVDIPRDHLLHEDFLKLEDNSSTKTLGIRWNACSDEFYFVASNFQCASKYTKREVLSRIAKLFDPVGWLSPCIVLAKIVMQRIWIDNTGWDELLLPETLNLWKTFEANYTAINSIRIPRWINYSPKTTVQFHGFCDASEKAYAAAIYIRISIEGSVSTNLISSKTKVAPIKTISVPRLELCGAVLLSEMVESLLSRLEVEKYTIFCWTDSKIVLSWLCKPPCNWLTFVANRVSKITQIVDVSQWNHVNSETNPADLASRGVWPKDLINNELWWAGPHWLKSKPKEWPIQDLCNLPQTNLEVKSIGVYFSYFTDFEDLLARFSSFSKAMRVMAYVYRFFLRTSPRFRSSFSKNSMLISSSEIVAIRNVLISVCQKVTYSEEYKTLSSKQLISKSSSILNLNPFLDKEGIIRSCGRLESAKGLTYNEKFPIVIPYNCQYARLLVKFIHDISMHGGNQLVLRLLRMEYWIPKAKNLIKTTINNCKICTIYKKRCQKQIMAALPPERSEISRPFTNTGIDFAGPFDVKSYSGRACRLTKGYVCIFVCFSTKAIHLEATSDLSTPAFLAAFNRFVSRRGCPLHLYSDNGTTFVGASKIIAKEFIQTTRQRIETNYAHQGVTWHFIPAGAPHMGGLWEAGVKSFKAHFRKITGCYKYTYEELSTLLTKIEACLNSRPISPISTDPSDLCALTPGHFLIGSPILAPIDPQTNESVSMANRWQRLKLIHQEFCQRWKNEYLKELHKRVKWQTTQINLEVGALVVVKDENLPSNSWRLGRIQKVYAGSDGRVRVADVLTQRGVITRPIVKLIVLPNLS